jgi:hypothetical protein
VVVAKRDVFVALMGIFRRIPWRVQCRALPRIVSPWFVFFTNALRTEEILTPLRGQAVDNLGVAFPSSGALRRPLPAGEVEH